MIIPFDNGNFVKDLQVIEKNLTEVEGIIFTYSGSPQITSAAPHQSLPKIISFAKKSDVDADSVKDKTFPSSKDFTLKHEHIYIEYCEVMNPAFKFYLISISIWGLITVFHILWTWIIKKDHSKHIQKILLFIPLFFAAYTLLDYIFFLSCPWSAGSGVQYLQIIQIALVTIFNTLFVGLCCFISKGWSIVRNSFTREELSSITMIVGIFYLVYSAYFIASDIPSLRVVIIVILIIMYIWVALTCLKNSLMNIQTIKSHIAVTGSDEIILKSLKLKKSLMVNFCIMTTLFYANKIVHSALRTFIDNNYIVRDVIIVNLFVELVIIAYFLLIFRSRKWPEYFGLDIFYQRIGNEDEQDNLPKSVILNVVTSSSWLLNKKSQEIMINGKEVEKLK